MRADPAMSAALKEDEQRRLRRLKAEAQARTARQLDQRDVTSERNPRGGDARPESVATMIIALSSTFSGVDDLCPLPLQ